MQLVRLPLEIRRTNSMLRDFGVRSLKLSSVEPTLVFLIDVLSWINVLGEIFSNLINVLPWINVLGGHFCTLYLVFATFLTCPDGFLLKLNWFFEIFPKLITVLSLIRMSWEEKCWKIIRMSWTSIRNTRVDKLTLCNTLIPKCLLKKIFPIVCLFGLIDSVLLSY